MWCERLCAGSDEVAYFWERESLSPQPSLRYDRTMQVRPLTSRRSLLWQWLLGLCLISCLVYIAWALHDFYERWQLAQVIAEIDAIDPHWRWEDIQARRPVIPDDQNMGNAINDIVIALRLHDMRSRMKDLPDLPVRNAYSDLEFKHKIDNYDLFLGNHPNAALPGKWKEPVAKLMQMSPVPEQLNKMRQLTNYRTGRFEHLKKKMSVLLVDIQGSHTVKQLLSYDAMLRLEAGDTATACRDCAAILAGARVYDHEDFPICLSIRGSVVSAAMRSLERILAQSNSVPLETLVQLQKAFELEEAGMPSLVSSLRISRAHFDKQLTEAQQGIITLSDFMEMKQGSYYPARHEKLTGWKFLDDILREIKPELFIASWARPQSWTMERKRMLECHGELLQWATLEDHLLLPEMQRLKKEGIRFSPFFGALHEERNSDYQEDGGYKSVEGSVRGYLIHRVACRASSAAIAAERYRLEHGHWPGTWEQLIPDYLAKVPIDPFSGKPLLLKTLPDHLVIYSIGANGIDDGGSVSRVDKKQIILDPGIRLYMPAQRGIDMSVEIKKLEAEWQNEP